MRMTRLVSLLAVAACARKQAAPPSTIGTTGPLAGAGSAGSVSNAAGATSDESGAASDAAGAANAPGAPAPVHPAVRGGKRTLLRAHLVPASIVVPAGFTLTPENAGEGVYDVFLAREPLSIRISNTHGCNDTHELELAGRRGETSIHDESRAAGHVRLWQGKGSKPFRIDACLDGDNADNSLNGAATCSALAASREDAELAYAICHSLELVLD
jgi:hypothetical protein